MFGKSSDAHKAGWYSRRHRTAEDSQDASAGNRLPLREAIERRRIDAEQRQALRDERSDAEQLERLEGAGHGHCKEAERLRARVEGTTS